MAFEGWVIKNGSTVLNNDLLAEKGYKSNPDQQTDEDSYTDGNGKLHRNILSHLRSKIWLSTNELSVAEKLHIQTVLPSRRLVTLTYWNDEREAYLSGDFYVPDIDWVMQEIDKKTFSRTYEPISVTLIEY
ncbi:hypothetical protein SAMN02746066_04554 [Anaerosporobacter mobilis DSM 15930]|jgi:hypothetical protein|uniref:Uncharacterized protein n=1 Tax=Anaerosporobacter mobilis DSM 15930 TaxID=1120996 RepID=A0A1M7NJ84_9FIRM|nr:DUF6711 family protein [Anaerosporobacter mobilis]SHN03904.1 hypothetical protein SAMN02746066_04554 [Anaerosporobacter mobilis DSM 15930]